MTTFTTNCTLPDGFVKYVTGPNIRGTLQILWSSLTALLLCTWTVQHLNVPQQSTPTTARQSWTRRIYRFVDKLKWLFISLLVPEFLIGKAFTDLYSAKQHLPAYEATAKKDGVLWSLSHCFLANMGGFVLVFETRSEPTPRSALSYRSDHHQDARSNAVAEDEHITENEGLTFSRAFTAPQPTKRPLRDPESQIPTEQASGKESERLHCPARSSNPKRPPTEDSIWPQQVESQNLERLGRMKDDPTSGSEAYNRAEMAQSRAVGKLRWTADASNTALVKAVLEQKHLQEFPTVWERELYLLFSKEWYLNLLALQGNVWSLDACQLHLARKMGIIEKLPDISKDELDDRNKGDFFVKGLALVQVIGLFVQIVARGAIGLPPSQLEISVIAFALCAFIIYILLWNKPQGVGTPVYITASRRPSGQELSRLAITGPSLYPMVRRDHLIPNHAAHCTGTLKFIDPIVSGGVVGAVAFGALHCAAWNLHFPTSIEHLLWKIAAVFTTAAPPTWVALSLVARKLGENAVKQKAQSVQPFNKIFDRLVVVFIVPYAVARFYIIVELFRSLLFLDAKTFSSTWSSNIPHIS